jgi:hypothetical protein
MKKLLFFFAIAFMMSSCSKDSVQDAFINESTNVSYQLGVNPWNDNNPHDSVGYHHNEVLKIFHSAYGDVRDYTIEQFEDSLLKVFQQYPFFENPTSIGFDLNEALNMISYNKQDSIIEYDGLFDNTSLSISAKEFFEDFVSGMTNSNFQDYQDFKNYVIINEEYLINNGDIFSSEEMFILLISTSVARHSGYLWYYEEDVVNYSGIIGWVIVGADAAGAIYGGIKDKSLKGAGIGAVYLSGAVAFCALASGMLF